MSRDEDARWSGSSMVDLDDTSNCPVGHRCESCGTESGDLAVETATSGRLGSCV